MAFWIILLFLVSTINGCEKKETVLQEKLTIAAWNVQRLGKTKASMPKVMEIFAQVIKNYDIIVLEEVTDSTGNAQKQLLEILNGGIEDERKKYSMLESARIGRTTYKEQYVFYYRHNIVTVSGTYQYPDLKDAFQIEPFAVLFDSPTSTTEKFGIIPIHTSPQYAPEEIDALVDVYDDVSREFGVKDAIILGDFNAGCSYVTEKEWESIRLRHDSRFLWLISDRVDTTVKASLCPYDRIVITGDSLSNLVYKDSAMPYYFDEDLKITDKELLYNVSDHYPVHLSLSGKHNISLQMSMGLNSEVQTTLSAIQKLKEDSNDVETRVHFEEENLLNQKSSQNGILFIEYKQQDSSTISSSLDSLSAKHPCIFTKELVQALKYKIANHFFRDASLYFIQTSEIQLSVLCLPDLKCSVNLKSPTKIN